MSRLRWLITAAAAAALALSVSSSTGTALAADWSISPVVSGLKLPRGIAFDGLGAMYVAESGLPGAGASGLTQGAVDKYTLGGSPRRVWSTPFISAYDSSHGGTEVIGPAGLSAVGGGCARSDLGVRNGCKVLVIVGLNSHEVPAAVAPDIGHLFQLESTTGAATALADVGGQQFDWAAAHSSLWSEFPDSNPYGVLVTRGGSAASGNTFVIDAGSNTVSEVAPDGTLNVIAYIPNEEPTPGLPLRDSTPTCAAVGPDGALYVGTLDLLRNLFDPNQGWSHVYRIDPNAHENFLTAAHPWASGLTTLTSCTFDSAGNFWGTEMFKFNSGGAPGDIVRIPISDPTAVEHIGGGRLPFPGGIAQGGDGAIYTTIFSTGVAAPIGAVMRVAQS